MLNDKILVFHIKTDLVIICLHLCEPNFFLFKQRKQGTSNGKLVSQCRKTSQLASCNHPAFSLAGCSLFNTRISHISMTIMTSKNQIFIIVRHLPADLYKGVLQHALQTKASFLLRLYIKFKSPVCDNCVFGKLG